LNINESKTRTRNLQNLLGKLESEPRRRHDVDAILIITTPLFAGQIKPLLAFHYASDIPVYATSHINSGQQNRARNNDLNGIRLPEVPWSLNRTLDIKASAEKFTPPAYTRFFAMGLDAFQLASRIELMQHFPTSVFQGQTGELYMNEKHQIRRRLEWAEFSDGVLISAPGKTQE
jgi:outer membrane PBP1 activator LpoA protein